MKTYLALTLDAEPAWFGYEKGTGHVVMSTAIWLGGDHIGGNPVMQPACSGSKPLDATRQTNKVTEKFQGDAKCKRCETWLKSLGAADAIECARDAAYTEANADMIAELKAERSPERLEQIAATERQWDSVAELGAQSKIAELVSDGVWEVNTPRMSQTHPEGVMALTPQERGDMLSANRRATRAKLVRPVTQSETASRGFLASAETRATEGAELLATVLTPEPVADDESVPSAPLSDVGLPKLPFPPAPSTLFHTGILATEAAIVRGKSQSGAPADRRMHKPGKGKPAEIASRGTMSDKNVRDHLDESVKGALAPKSAGRYAGQRLDSITADLTTHPDVVKTYGVTLEKFLSKSVSWQRTYRRKLSAKSAAAYAADSTKKGGK